jgi:predicted dienelactone hydrolase
MRAVRAFLLLLPLAAIGMTAAALATPAAPVETYKKAPGPFLVSMALYNWTDPGRNRLVPVKVYSPVTGKGPFPVIVFSHGLGGSREGYKYLGSHWASHGYVSVHINHLGSDTAVLTKSGRPMRELRRAATDPGIALERPLDVRFVLDQLEKMNQGGSPLAHRLDLQRVGMAGHSFGAWTTLVVAGQNLGRERAEASLADPRVKAAIAMSAPVPRKRENFDRAYGGIHIPILHMTGTRDDSPLGETKAAERRVPYDHIHGADQYLVTFQGGDHMIFSGRLTGSREKDPLFQDLIRQGTVAFWDAYLKGDAEAKAWLAQGYGAVLGKDGKLERKP